MIGGNRAATADGGTVQGFPAPGVSSPTVEHLYLNQVQPLALGRQGKLVCHASAIESPGGALAFLGVSVDGMDVHHKNGNKLDNRPENLEVMTRADHITTRKPAAQWKRKDKRFSEKDVIDIRARRKSGVSQTILALEYGVSQCAISKIASGETYQDIGGPRVSGRTCKRGRSRDGNTTHIR